MAKAKAKDTAKEAPKARTSKAKEKAAEKALLAGALTEAPAPMDAEARKTRLKNLIKLGKQGISQSHVDSFVVISGDSDFSPLVTTSANTRSR